MRNKLVLTNNMLQGVGSKPLFKGTTTDKQINYYGWGDSDKRLKFVVCKGYINDWALYIQNMSMDQSYLDVERIGNKLSKDQVKLLVDCSDEVMERYRL